MLVSHKWISKIAGIQVDPEELGRLLTFSGLELDGIEPVGFGLDKIVVGEIISKKAHPDRKKLSVVEVDSGAGLRQVVCGAPNTPGPGGRVALGLVNAKIGDVTIETRELAGVKSEGMICSEQELNIGPDHEGILILNDDTDAEPGTPIAQALDLEDWIYDISITPNRPDALSHMGIAREAALLMGRPFEPKRVQAAPEDGTPAGDLANVELLDTRACPRYGAAVLTGIEVRKSPFAVRYRLHNLGVRPISNLVDTTNWIVLEHGQPLHAFDLDTLAGAKIVIRKARQGEKMITLDEIERVLSEDDLLICDADRPVAVAGVMGGLDTGVTQKTKNLLIECAYFEPSGIRRTSRRLKLASESSYRFERGIDPNMGPKVLAAAASMTVNLAGGTKAPGLIDCYPEPITSKVVPLRPARFGKLMGFQVPPVKMRRILEGLGAVVGGDDSKLSVTVPTARPDIEREVDLIEEVARIRGFGEVPSTLPRVRCRRPDRRDYEATRKAKELLASLGLYEAVNYSFVSEELLNSLGSDNNVVPITNPLSAERATMRSTLIAGLLENLSRAHSRFLPGIRQFEVGRTFHNCGEELPKEMLRAAAVISGPMETWASGVDRKVDFFDIKGIVERFILEYTGIEPVLTASEEIACLHPKRACLVLVEGKTVGFAGEIHPKILQKRKQPRGACAFELVLDELWSMQRVPAVKPLIEYPPMVRDVALLVDANLDSGPIAKALKEECGSLAIEVSLFDVYSGKGISNEKKSLAFSIVYRSENHTLTDDEVDAAHKAAVAKILKRFDASLR
ncbi:MAG: phenylalanine--tRNA ligase subunit beta [Proteobacteria bacterium]|nr:phenylalanine--tRNA ligase subunit beta [Pseudomonadota bacterium]